MQCPKCKSEVADDSVYCAYCGKKLTTQSRKPLKRANGTGTVYKLQGRRTRPWVAAKNKVVIGYYTKKTDALKALELLTNTPVTERYNMTFADVFKEWSEEHYKTIGASAIRAYNAAYKIFAPIHNRKFRELRTSDFQNALDASGVTNRGTALAYKKLITQMSEWAIREQIATTNFATYVTLPDGKTAEKTIFSVEDIGKLEADRGEAARIVLMLIYTGMRIGELFQLPLKDYHGNYCVGGEKTKAGKNRVIPIRPEGREHFEYFARIATGDLLLSGYVGNHDVDKYRKHDYYPLLERLEIPKRSPHSTRHTYTTWAVNAGMKPEVLQKILGHANYQTTADVYTHIDDKTVIEAVEIC